MDIIILLVIGLFGAPTWIGLFIAMMLVSGLSDGPSKTPTEPLPAAAKWFIAMSSAFGFALVCRDPEWETLRGIAAISAGVFFVAGLLSFRSRTTSDEKPWLEYAVFRPQTSPHIEVARPSPKKPRLTLQEHLVCLKELSKV